MGNHREGGFGSEFTLVRSKLGSFSKLGSGLARASAAAGHGDAKDALGARGAGGGPPLAARATTGDRALQWP